MAARVEGGGLWWWWWWGSLVRGDWFVGCRVPACATIRSKS